MNVTKYSPDCSLEVPGWLRWRGTSRVGDWRPVRSRHCPPPSRCTCLWPVLVSWRPGSRCVRSLPRRPRAAMPAVRSLGRRPLPLGSCSSLQRKPRSAVARRTGRLPTDAALPPNCRPKNLWRQEHTPRGSRPVTPILWFSFRIAVTLSALTCIPPSYDHATPKYLYLFF